jgi:hypothetical protein
LKNLEELAACCLEARPYSAAKGKEMLEEWFEVRKASHRYLELELSLLRCVWRAGRDSEEGGCAEVSGGKERR